MSSRNDELWSYVEIAAHIGVKPETVRSYRRHGLLPQPDRTDRLGHPRWYPDTIRHWAGRRPGNRG
jgi:DNA-binding transcriptional MerR regulator